MKKICVVCKREKNFSEYHNSSRSKDGKNYRCKTCDRKAREKYIANNSERNKTLSRIKQVKFTFNLSDKELMEMMNNQRGCCKICGDSLVVPDSNKMYAIDHCHETGKVRGLLCLQCNAMLGQAKEDKEILYKGYLYLIKSQTH